MSESTFNELRDTAILIPRSHPSRPLHRGVLPPDLHNVGNHVHLLTRHLACRPLLYMARTGYQ